MLAWAGLFGLSVLVVGLVLLFLWHPRMGELFHRHVRDRPKRRLFLAAVGFFLTLALARGARSEEHTSELQSRLHLVCRLLLEKKKKIKNNYSQNVSCLTEC